MLCRVSVNQELKNILDDLKEYSLIIRSLPSVSEIAKGNISISELTKVNIEDLLQREVRKPIEKLIAQHLTGICFAREGNRREGTFNNFDYV